MLRRYATLTLIVAILVLPSLVFAASHKVAVGAAQAKTDRIVTIPLEITNESNLMAADIPLQYSDGVTLKEVNFENTRVEHFDLKVANINEETRTVIIGLMTQMSPTMVPDLESGEGPIAHLVFQIDDPSVTDVTLDAVEIEEPNHKLMFIYHTVGADGKPTGQREAYPSFTSSSFSLEGGDDNSGLPATFALAQNYPNPFNPSTEISFSLPTNQHVELDIFNVLGQKVRSLVNQEMAAGEHTVMWDGRNAGGATVSSGVYFYRIAAGDFTDTKKMMMLK